MLTCILVTTIATAIYSCVGGVRSVVWNDCIQFAVYMVGGDVRRCGHRCITANPGGWDELVRIRPFHRPMATVRLRSVAHQAERYVLVRAHRRCVPVAGLARRRPADRAALSVCQEAQSSASWALGISGFVVFAQFALFLLIGVELACFYSTSAAGIAIDQGRRGVHDLRRQSHGHRA